MSGYHLVSLCITCYNQKKYIAKALQSAFSQDYPNLEIVVCDDGSTDGTDLIARDIIASYKGPHTIVFERNAVNLGIARNYYKCFTKARGFLRVTGSGDDISFPNRVSRIVDIWKRHNRPFLVAHSGYIINPDGIRTGRSIGTRNINCVLGAAVAYDARVFEYHYELPRECFEDWIFPHTASMMGDTCFTDEPLIEYRIGGESSRSHLDNRITQAKCMKTGYVSSEILLKILEAFHGKMADSAYAEKKDYLSRRLLMDKAYYDLLTASRFSVRLRGFKIVRARNIFLPVFFHQCVYLLPHWMGVPILSLYTLLNDLRKKFFK